MADIAGLYALMAALGAAGIGAVAGGLVQGAKGRQDAAAVELQRRQHEDERRRMSADLALEANATARSAGRAWLSGVERVLQELELGRAIDIGRFDEEFNQLQSELTQSVYRLAAATAAVPQVLAGGLAGAQPYIEQIAETTLLIRSDLLRVVSGLPSVHGSSDLRTLAALVGTELHGYAEMRTERLRVELARQDERRLDIEHTVRRSRAEERVERLRSQVASARADEALYASLQQNAAANADALASARERIEANESVEELEASLQKAEQAWLGERDEHDHAEARRQLEIIRRLVESGQLPPHQAVDLRRVMGLPPQPGSLNPPEMPSAAAPQEVTVDTAPGSESPDQKSSSAVDDGE
ncbi:hypothetical protein OG596_38430 (plasmid) [Streptomyces sp. NBC_01102]|uniref:hypothetical protein n=1 Tax=Streptomyces sp. NBC_01102 TaxID=2903749 RepID=UPI002F91AB1A|nr:hypothetical protein OG596_38430 [Streptomyces sp. NBC_01102]